MRRPVTPPKTTARRAARVLRGVVVVIDPGHGGTDPGASRAGVVEATLTYRMAATLAAVVTALGAEVRFTVRSAALRRKLVEGRPEPKLLLPRDATLPSGQRLDAGRELPEFLHARAATAARAWKQERPPVVFLSLHFDVSGDSGDHGGFAMWDIRGDHPPLLAREITRRFEQTGLCGSRRSRPNDLGVLNPEFNPVPQKTLVELATITNASDRKKALDPKWRWRVARILAAAIIACRKAKLI